MLKTRAPLLLIASEYLSTPFIFMLIFAQFSLRSCLTRFFVGLFCSVLCCIRQDNNVDSTSSVKENSEVEELKQGEWQLVLYYIEDEMMVIKGKTCLIDY